MTLSTDLARERLADARIYLLLTRELCRLDPLVVLDEALAAGVDVVQVREPGADDREFLEWVHDVRERCALHRAPVIVNDRPDVALLAGADGVHLGQDDLPPRAVRELVGPKMLLGLSTHDADQVETAADEPIDYIGVGPLFDTDTKGLEGTGTDWVPAALEIASVPVFGIGGISPVTIQIAADAGLGSVAVSSAICGAEEPGAVVHELRAAFEAESD